MKINTEKDKKIATLIAKKVREMGGRTFYVGGYVRDEILGRENKDIDIEIHGISLNDLRGILQSIGKLDERKVGDNFGIFALNGYSIDIAMPRCEKPTGDGGHKDFVVEVDPFIGYENAAKRRDFTINALMKDVLTGEILDFYGGLEDLKRGVIRHVNDATYGEDPLRVLRAAQFASRFGFTIADETIALSEKMDLSKLSCERIAGELDKALLKSDKPSIFFNELRKMGQLSTWFPEVEALIDCPQHPDFHPEGDAYTHTMMVLDEASKCKSESSNPRYFMVTALCHDFGKPAVTVFDEKKGRVIAHGHDKEGSLIASKFVGRIYNENCMQKYVKNLTELHMTPLFLVANEHSSNKSYVKMYDRCISPEDLILLSRCDSLGTGRAHDFSGSELILRQKLEVYKDLMEKPHVTGQDLIELGFKPSPAFSKILEYAHNCHLSGVDKDRAIKQILGEFKAFRDSDTEKSEPEASENDYV